MATFSTRIAASLRAIMRDEDGAITVDWVVLTAAVIGMAFGVMTQISGATISLSSKIQTGIASKPLGAETSGENSDDSSGESSGGGSGVSSGGGSGESSDEG